MQVVLLKSTLIYSYFNILGACCPRSSLMFPYKIHKLSCHLSRSEEFAERVNWHSRHTVV